MYASRRVGNPQKPPKNPQKPETPKTKIKIDDK
jgi:hypothetical protein